jgi:hypothetical protein
MADPKCAHCGFRAKYDKNPHSFLGWLWRWHAGWCPGWKAYILSLPADARKELAEKYKMPKYLDKK